MPHTRFTQFLLFLAPLFLAGCLLNPLTPMATVDPGAIHTAAAKTIVAQVTLSAGETAVVQLTQMASGGWPTPTPAAATLAPASPTPPQPATAWPTTAPIQPTWTAIPPQPTPWPTWTPIPPAPTPIPPTWAPPPPPPPPPTPCEWVQFVKDVTIPDGSVINPGAPFTKVWRLRNIGACTWNAGYSLVFVSGDRMQVRNAYPLPGTVRPGETVDVSADFVAPGAPGRYRSNWMLSNPYGQTFGIGANAQTPFWVAITVKSGEYVGDVFDFAANLCAAEWSNGNRDLPCPGDPDSGRGSAVWLGDPTLETGKHENEPAIWTRPRTEPNGMIMGVYPPFLVKNGDRFMSDIGCMEGSKRCDVVFSLDYQAENGAVRNLGSWHEVYDRMIYRVNVDLSSLAGQKVRFILRVENRGEAEQADALWLVPGIRRSGGGTPPTPPPPDWEDLPAVQAAVRKLARDLGIPRNQVRVTLVEEATWPDACLGIYVEGQSCAQVIVPGYRVMMTAGGERHEAHTDKNGDIVFWVQIY